MPITKSSGSKTIKYTPEGKVTVELESITVKERKITVERPEFVDVKIDKPEYVSKVYEKPEYVSKVYEIPVVEKKKVVIDKPEYKTVVIEKFVIKETEVDVLEMLINLLETLKGNSKGK